jgi:replicative DNA helicase
MAKSTVAINMAHRIAVQGIGTAVFSMETTNVSLYDKLVATLTQIPIDNLKKNTKDLSKEDHQRIANSVQQIAKLPILLDDQPTLNVDSIFYQIQSAQRRGYDPKVIFIDLFGKVEGSEGQDNKAARIERDCQRMRALAKILNVHFVLVVQIGRQGYGRGRGGRIKRPNLIDIKNANAYAEEADLVLLLHRNKYYLPDLEDDILEIDVAKQRDGEPNTRIFFEMFGETATLVDTDKMPHDMQAA